MHIPKTYAVTDLRGNQAEIFDNLKDAPVLLTRQGRAAAVLVDPEKWNALLDLVEDLEDRLRASEVKLQLARGETETVPLHALEIFDGETALSR
ncbi:MAG: type II toxin-antitoxin system Phd/YefM family antitoxin [Caldilineaceae bacterium]|nr:type II toxin-antitoxin system Phd/YefM family antitoxin [Caldilineaceae bacterium]